MRAEAPSASAVNAQIDKISRLQADGMKAHFDTFMQARAVLTPEQLKKLRTEPGPMKMEHDRHGED
jgi:Spy/CpxP family protein refolding chaperone